MKQGVNMAKQALKKKIMIAVAPYVLGFFLIILVIIIVASPVLAAKESVDKAANSVGTFFERFAGFFSGNGWNTDEEAFFKLLNDEKISCDQATLVTATIMYYYQTVPSSEIELGGIPEDTNEAGESVDIYDESIFPYGKMLPDLKKLVKKVKKGDRQYEDYVKNTFLVKEPYVKLLEGQVENTTGGSDSEITTSDDSGSGFYENIVTANSDDGYKILVNKNSKLPSNYSPDLVNMENGYTSVSGAQMEKTAYKYFKKMVDAAKKDGITLYSVSSYRTYDTQNYLYNNYVNGYGKDAADTFSARPRHSEHETGLAVDINTADENAHFENTKEYEWLSNNAHKYGFILRYLQGKEDITGFIFEPWHYRYLGEELATKVKNSGLTYDEYYTENFGSPGSSSSTSNSSVASNPKKDKIYEEMKQISEAVECPKKNGNSMVCRGNYEATETAEIDIKDLDNVYVNVASGSCVQGSLEGCTDWIATEVPFKEYIMGVVLGENGGTPNLEALKAQFVASKSYTIGRIRGMGRTWHEVGGNYIIYMKGSTDDQVYLDINSQPEDVRQLYSDIYDETLNYFIIDDNNQVVDAAYCSDFGVCDFCVSGQGTCFAQETANRTTGQTYKEILGYHYSAYKLYDMSDKSIQVSTVDCTYTAGGGSIREPLDSYIISSGYGGRGSPIWGTYEFHNGLDLAAPLGEPIYAIAPGYVGYATFNTGGYGYTVVLFHDIDADGDFDYSSLYAHCSELLVKQGESVAGGQEIAKVGSTGWSTGPHVHFTIGKHPDATDTSLGMANLNHVDPGPLLEDIRNGTSIFNEMIISERKYYNQGSYKSVAYCDGSDTIANSGALPTSFAMVVASLKDGNATPSSVAKTICGNEDFKKYKSTNGGTDDSILTYIPFLSKYGLNSKHYTSDYETHIKNELKAGKILIANVKGGTFNLSGGGHYVALMEINGKNEVLVYDPTSDINSSSTLSTYHSINDVTLNISGGIWVFN